MTVEFEEEIAIEVTEKKEHKPARKPRLSPDLERQLERALSRLDEAQEQIKSLTLDRSKQAPVKESEPQVKLSQKEINAAKEIYLKPNRTVSSRERFNEDFRSEYEFAKEYVCFIAENKELIGSAIEIWTKPFPGLPAEEWVVPVNKPVWGPRYLAEQIKRKTYSRLKMDENTLTGQTDGVASYTGAVVVEEQIQRLDCRPATTKKSIF